MTITAKFSTVCPVCQIRIAAGTQVEWSKGSPARHVACSGAAAKATRPEPTSLDGSTAIRGQHWSTRGNGPTERLCAGGCARRVSPKYAECYGCMRESMDAM